MTKKLTQEEASNMISAAAYELKGIYLGRRYSVDIYCPKHKETHRARFGNVVSGCLIRCCHLERGIGRKDKLDPDTVRSRLATMGYTLVGEYVGVKKKVLLRCGRHGVELESYPANIFNGGRMKCCGKESMREKLSERSSGSGNHFYGKRHSIETREKLSRHKIENPSAHIKTQNERMAISARLKGVPRTADTKSKLSAKLKERYSLFGYCVRMARSGKTAGKQGIFYIVRIGDRLKMGSATTTMAYRLGKLRARHGSVELVAYCLVDDAGRYEADCMERCQQHWSHGEYFHDWLRAEQ